MVAMFVTSACTPSATGSKIVLLSFMSSPGSCSEFVQRAPVSLGVLDFIVLYFCSVSQPKDLVGEKFKSDR